jgi:uncharacterized protein involved in exopolysaccharide biosynthesis
MPTQTLPENTLLSIRQITAMLLARRWLIVFITVLVVAMTVAVVMLTPKAWTASTELYVDYKENDPIGGRAFSAMLDESYMQTQIAMLRSRIVAERVVDKLGLKRSAEFQEAVQAVGETRAFEAMIKSINEKTETTSARGSRVVVISHTNKSPEAARDIANAIIEAYVALTQQIATNSARSRSEQYRMQLEQLRGEAEALQEKISAYQRETGIVDQQDTTDIAQRQFNEMASAATQIQARQQAAQARNRITEQMLQSGMRPDELPEISGVLAVADLKSRLNTVNERIENVSSVLGANHPTLRSLIDERNQVQARLTRAARSALDAQRNELATIRMEGSTLQQTIDTQRGKLLENLQHRDQLSAYRRQLASAEQVYNAALQKYDGLLMASNITQPSITALRPAELPSNPSHPVVRRSLMLGLLAGIFASLCLALLLELRQRRIRCDDDVIRGVTLPLLGRVGRPDLEVGA